MVGHGGGLFEELDDDVCGDFFDHIDDLLDFPTDELDVCGAGGLLPAEIAHGGLDLLWPTSVPEPLALSASSPPFSSGHASSLGTDEDLAAGLSVPPEDIAQLEWLSSFVEDSFSAGNIDLEEDLNHKDSQFRTSSPVSVLDSSSSTGKPMPLGPHMVVPGRARSKRPRPASFAPRLPVSLVSPASSCSETDSGHPALPYITCAEFPPELDSFAESESPTKKVAKKKKNLSLPALDRPGPAAGQQNVRKCMHCEITKTPQWRAGPMGPKTLCNACGVRYKSGRLYPEYRPAASPTFVAALHSNSHKKVVEMRVKSGQKGPAPVPQFVRKNSNHLALLEYQL